MSRSRRKTPIIGNLRRRSEKQDKRFANRALRAGVRSTGNLDLTLDDVSNIWDFNKDGKIYDAEFRTCRGGKLMRK